MRWPSQFRPGLWVTALAMSLMITGCGTAGTEDADAQEANEDTEATPEVTEAQQAMSQVALGRSLADYGLEHGAPLALAAAAEILMGVETDDVEGTPEMEDATDDPTTDEEAPGPEELLAEAEELAQGNEALLGAVRRVQQRLSGGVRGAIRGPRDGFYRVNAGATNVHRVTFRGRERATVYINGDNDTDLDLWVYDENGNLIGRSISWNDEEAVSWVPRWTGPFIIRVRNLGGIWNRYYFAHN